MAQPDYVPVTPADKVRQAERLPPAKRWAVDRPGEIPGMRPPEGDKFGVQGPDQGYALTLAERFRDRLRTEQGEHVEDAVAGCLGVALKRAALFGRAPVIYDLELAFRLWGFMVDTVAPRELVQLRRKLFEGASHHYWDQREITDRVPEDTLRLSPAAVGERLSSDWEELISVD